MSDKRDFDPRFDPAFQRGFVEGSAAVPQQPPRQPSQPMVEPPERWAKPGQVTDVPAQQGAPAAHLETHPEPVSLDGNPWVRVLWIVAATFTIVGMSVQGWASSMNGGAFSSSDVFRSMVLPTLSYSLAPAMVQVGLAALVGVVFLHAVRWRADR